MVGSPLNLASLHGITKTHSKTMCGIGGFLDENRAAQDSNEILSKMAHIMRFRGPESSDTFPISKGGLVHNRLKIIDLSDRANQPMTSVCGDFTLVFNGEIYNFKELREKYQLTNLKTGSDTEVLLEALANFPIKDVLSATKGMFALALFQHSTNTFFLARDRFGQKPLYYYLTDKQFYFCSDIRGISRNINNLSLDYESIDYYLSELAMPQPKTIFKEIKQLNPGSFARLVDFKLTEESYHSIKIVQEFEDRSEQEWLSKVEEGIITASKRRLISDVNIGFFLSGGVDSGLIVALTAQLSDKPIDTYTAIYDEKDFDESKDAKKVAARHHTNHHEIKINSANVDEVLWNLIGETGEPFADSSLLPSYFVTKEMSQYVTVAISGDGGDELFGYPEYQYALNLQEFDKKSKFHQQINALKAKAINKLSATSQAQAAAYAFSLKHEMNGQLLDRKMGFSTLEKQGLYRDENLKKSNFVNVYHKGIWNGIDSNRFYTKKLIGGYKTRLLNDYLVKVDRSSMFNSLEVRSPFLDHDLVDLVNQIPGELNFKNNQPKYLLKKLAEKHVDSTIFSRKKKGFGIPVTYWLKNELKSYVDKYLSAEQLAKRGLFNPDFVQKLWQEHERGVEDHRHKIWAILCLEIWFDQELDRN